MSKRDDITETVQQQLLDELDGRPTTRMSMAAAAQIVAEEEAALIARHFSDDGMGCVDDKLPRTE